MIRTPKSGLMFLLFLIGAVPRLIGGTPGQGLEIRIEGFTRAHRSVIFDVLVANRGSRSVYLRAVDKRGKELGGIGIEQYREPRGWAGFEGRWVDGPPANEIVRLHPGEELASRIWIPDPFVEILKSPPREIPVVGKHRATVWYYASNGAARNAKDGYQAVSEPIDVPRGNGRGQ